MNVLVATDMEGIGGIDDYRDCLPSHPAAYARGCRLMTDEALVVIEALREAGADGRIAVGDWHMVGTNVERERIPGAEVRPIAELALVEDEPSMSKAHGGPLDAVVFIGHHAGTRNPRAFCSHTFVWEMEVTLDGEPLNEVQVYAQGLAAEGIPVLAASGDRWMLEELGDGELGGARLVPTKEGQGQSAGPLLRSARPPGTSWRRRSPRRWRRRPRRRRRAATRPSCGSPSRARSWRGDRWPAPATCWSRSPTSSAPAPRSRASTASSPSCCRPSPPRSHAAPHRRLGAAVATPVMLGKERSWLRAAPA